MSLALSRRAGFAAALRVREFRALWLAEAQSMAGDQLARVALAILVFDRTGSPALTALTYALTFLPAIVGGAVLGGLADRWPRRRLMVACDVLRAVLLGVMAIPAVPTWAVCALLVVSVLAGRPFLAAQSAILPSVLRGELFVLGSGLRMVTDQVAQLLGFALGGVAIALIGAHAGLAVDAATFAVSAVLLLVFVGEHRPPAPAGPARSSMTGRLGSAVRLMWADPQLRTLAGLGWLAGLHVVPEGVAAPYAAEIGGGAVATGLLMAALPAGSAIGALVVVRLGRELRSTLVGPLAVAVAIPMMVCVFRPGLGWSLVLWALSGLFAGYQVQAATTFVRRVPDERRGQVLALASSGLVAIQGVGILVFGAVADYAGPARAVALAGLVAFGCAVPLAAVWSRVRGVHVEPSAITGERIAG